MSKTNQQAKSYSLFFKLERVENGYILSAKENSEGLMQEPKFRKEVVTNDRIALRIGSLLSLDTLVKEHPVVFHVEAIGEKTYKIDDMPNYDNIMTAKLAFVHFNSRKYPTETVIVLHLEDTNMIEIYGRDAERLAESNSLALNRSQGIPFLRFPNSKDGLRALANIINNPSVLKVSEAQILNWYNSHKILQESTPPPPSPPTNQSTCKQSNTTKK